MQQQWGFLPCTISNSLPHRFNGVSSIRVKGCVMLPVQVKAAIGGPPVEYSGSVSYRCAQVLVAE